MVKWKKTMVNRMTLQAFVIYFVCICVPVSALLGFIHLRTTAQERRSYEQEAASLAAQTAARLEEKLLVLVSTGNSIFYTQWYQHYRNIAEIYAEEFDVVKRRDISRDLQIQALSMEFVSDILVVTPDRDSVITNVGWYSTAEYLRFYGDVQFTLPQDAKTPVTVTPADDTLCVLALEDLNTRLAKSTVCLLLDKKLFARYLQQLHTDAFACLEVTLNGQPLYQSGSAENTRTLSHALSKVPDTELRFGYIGYEQTLLPGRRTDFFMQLVIAVLASMILSFLLTYMNIQPLNRLLKRFTRVEHRSTQAAYRYLDDCVASMSVKNRELSAENRQLSSAVTQYLRTMKNEIIFSMLTNSEFNFRDEYICGRIPWLNDGLPYALAIAEPKEKGTALDETAPGGRWQYFRAFRVMENEYCLLFWFADLPSAHGGLTDICDWLDSRLEDAFYYTLSGVLTEPGDMREQYPALKRDLSGQREADCALPISVQIKLITKIQNGHFEECRAILNQARRSHSPEAALLLLSRIAGEYGIDPGPMLTAYRRHLAQGHEAEIWNLIISNTRELCSNVNSGKQKGLAESATVIRRFIDEHWNDPDMSIKLLADRFALDGTLVSKIFKAHTGMSFSDYLLETRMKQALQLLARSDESLTAISEAVGYTNYLTFKRAFIRYQGISPREYREVKA